MKPVQRTLPANYSVRNIIDCILSDNNLAKKYSITKKVSFFNIIS